MFSFLSSSTALSLELWLPPVVGFAAFSAFLISLIIEDISASFCSYSVYELTLLVWKLDFILFNSANLLLPVSDITGSVYVELVTKVFVYDVWFFSASAIKAFNWLFQSSVGDVVLSVTISFFAFSNVSVALLLVFKNPLSE
ncbi:hypothetical protein MMELEA_02330 [Mycoplasmopsis meleagridis ATCC 25294]|uniref:Uncharacterized protein n=1 Tax=Mycoplasmopsis meleagridis ATCC 25294 TaxID=1264554 RepID=A0A0F5H058_9BACT|nr:hypothetical protein MMELEA_02330 [Mycoplasmopsis meleagridis ATCC 25294]